MKNIVPASTKFKLMTGEEIDLLLNFRGLALLQNKDPNLYKALNKFIFSADDVKNMDLLETTKVIYACYKMHQLYYQLDVNMSYEDFLDLTEFNLDTLMNTFAKVLSGSKKKGFSEVFRKRTHRTKRGLKTPKMVFEQLEDYYSYYVLILKISEDVFWNLDIPSLNTIVDNKQAYDGWMDYVLERERDRRHG